MTMCLCSSIRKLVDTFDEQTASCLASELGRHLSAIRTILAKSKPLSRDVGYQVVPNNQRTSKILAIRQIDYKTPEQIYHRFRDNVHSFWREDGDGAVHADLRRRLMCIIIYLRSTLDAQTWVSPDLENLAQGQKLTELRYAGKKYIKMGRKLGGVGSILWLPLEVPSSTYERYLNMDDEESFSHLSSLVSAAPDCTDFVKELVSSQFQDLSSDISKGNLFVNYGDMFPDSDRILLLLAALGGTDIPLDLLKAVRQPQRRWVPEGETIEVSPDDFALPPELVNILADDTCLARTGALPSIQQNILDDGTEVWSIRPEELSLLETGLSPATKETWASIALGVICYACPPVFEGKVIWPREKKKAIWALLDRATSQKKVSQPRRTHAIDALLFLVERDLFAIRQIAVKRARSLLLKSMPFYFHASVTLFESIVLRLEGNIDKSNAKIGEFLNRNQNPQTHCDNAMMGRLHISWVENKIHRYESDVASVMYEWQGMSPLSTFEIEVTRRLQGTVARYFHSIGDFQAARASLEQHLSLDSTLPIRENTRLLITSKLAEMHCELGEFDAAHRLVHLELDSTPQSQRKSRPFRRLSMVSAEADLGRGMWQPAGTTLEELLAVEPPELDDLNDQVLHMRRLILMSRVVHAQSQYNEALNCWRATMERMEQLSIFSARHPWTAAVIYLSMAHAHLGLGDLESAREMWAHAVEISKSEKCEYVLPTLASAWVPKIVGDMHRQQGWAFRMMLPGGRPDVTWS